MQPGTGHGRNPLAGADTLASGGGELKRFSGGLGTVQKPPRLFSSREATRAKGGEKAMAKTPGTKPSGADDTSQQPTQKKTPTARENKAVTEEDHIKKREALTEKERRRN
jgi:hypothetical protein